MWLSRVPPPWGKYEATVYKFAEEWKSANFLFAGRAWLFMALNESLLESYIRCYQQNQKLVNQYYVNDALVRDQQVLYLYVN